MINPPMGWQEWESLCYSRGMEPTGYDTATAINLQIGAVSRLVEAFQERIRADEITTTDQAEAFFTAWLEGMRTLAQ